MRKTYVNIGPGTSDEECNCQWGGESCPICRGEKQTDEYGE